MSGLKDRDGRPSVLPTNYQIRLIAPSDYKAIIEICRLVYPTETPYTLDELEDHRRVFPQGQFVASDDGDAVAGVHFTLRLRLADFHIDDPWDVLTAGGSFLDHDPEGPTLYGADIMVHPQGLRTDFSGGQHLEEIVGIERADHAFRPGAALQRLLLAEQADDQAANGTEVRRTMAVLLPSRILVEAHIEHPVLTILDAPMLANGPTQ